MAESQLLTAIRVWAAIAWADGVLAEAEADSMRRLIATADLTADERTTATTFVDAQCTLPDSFVTALSPEARRGVYRAACRMAVVDRTLAKAERGMLDRVRELLGISTELAGEIEADVPGLA